MYGVTALAVLLGTGLVWMSSDVRTLEFLKPYVQSAASSAFSPFVLETGKIHYTVDTDSWALVTGLQDVSLRDGAGHRVAVFSQVNLDIGLFSLLSGSPRFETLEIVKPALHMTKQDNGRVTLSVTEQHDAHTPQTERSLPQEQEEEAMPASGLMAALKAIAVKTLVVRDAEWSISSRGEKVTYDVPRVTMVTHNRGDVFSIQFDARVREADQKTSRLTGSLDIHEAQERLSLSAALSHFNIRLLAALHAYGPFLSGADIRLNGTIALDASFQGELQKANLDLHAKEGRYSYAALFPEPVVIDTLRVKAAKAAHSDVLAIEQLKFVNEDMALKVNGEMALGTQGFGADVQAKIDGLRIARIGAYWPPGLSEDAREWVTTNLQAGEVSEATARLRIAPGALSAGDIPDDLLRADIAVKGATVSFLPGFDAVTQVNGNVIITASSLDIKADSGDFMRGTQLTAAHLRIPDFAAPGIPMEFSLTLDATAPDVAEMIGPTRLDLASALKLDPEKITGKAKGKVDFALPLYSKEWPQDKPYITYAVAAALDNVSQDGVLGKWDIAGMTGELAVDNTQLTLKTRTDLQGIASELAIMRDFGGAKATTYTLVADIPARQMPLFGFEVPEQIDGILGVDAKVRETDAQSVTKAKVNLSNTSVTVSELNYAKMPGVPAVLTITQEAKGQQNIVPEFSYTADDAKVAGSFTQDRKSGDFLSMDMKSIRLGRNDFAMTYRTAEGRKIISIRGALLDLSPPSMEEGKPPAPKAAAKADENPLDAVLNSRIDVDLEHIKMAPESGFSEVKGVIDCGVARCHHVSLASNTKGGTPFTFVIGQEQGARRLHMASADAGGVIQALDISEHVVGGSLDFKGEFDDSTPASVLKGRLLITEFQVVKGPILAKLLSLASLTGFLDVLAGKGIAFSKLAANTSYSGTTLRIHDAKAFGSAIGITVKGRVRPFQSTMDISGTVVPAYAANSVIGKIPLLGTLLTGGDGGGFIAANYSMKGGSDDPDVMVNPLSLLTPGFLRNLFDVFDSPEAPDGEEEPGEAEDNQSGEGEAAAPALSEPAPDAEAEMPHPSRPASSFPAPRRR